MNKTPIHESLIDAWQFLLDTTKHKTRYFFHAEQPNNVGEKDRSPAKLLKTLGGIVEPLNLIKRIEANTDFFRARIWSHLKAPEANDLGAPPKERASAGRMNPAGISYLYLATDKETALAEVIGRPPCNVAVAHFINRDKLIFLDLSDLPDPDSIPDDTQAKKEALKFLHHFVHSISQPVERDGHEHVSYVPSQVVCEYFAQIYPNDIGNEKTTRLCLHGIMYPSVIRDGGKNLVLFPQPDDEYGNNSLVSFHSCEVLHFNDWQGYSTLLEPKKPHVHGI